mgnify:CR=1 FL=1
MSLLLAFWWTKMDLVFRRVFGFTIVFFVMVFGYYDDDF